MGTLLLAAVLIVALSRLLGGVLERVGQPRVIGEVLAGVVLGTIGLHGVFRPGVVDGLTVIGEAALAAYVFRVVAGLDPTALRRDRDAVLSVGAASFAVPFLAGVAVALVVGRTGLAAVLFLATAFAVTAFPVLARIVEQRGLAETRPGRVSLGAAAAQELLIWPLLGVAVGLAADGSPVAVATRGAVALGVTVLLARFLPARLALVGLAVAATASQLAGLHVVLGAFAFALALPVPVRRAAVAALHAPVPRHAIAVLLPLFFAVPALRVDLGGLLSGGLPLLAGVLAVAVSAKFASATLAAARAGLDRRDALVVGALMNTRGLVELVVLSAGLRAGLIDVRLYTAMVAMALITTLAAGPLLRRLSRRSGGRKVRALCARTASS